MVKKNKIFGLLLIIIAVLIFCCGFTTEKINEKMEEVAIDEKISLNKGYFAILEIPKVSLKKEIYEITDAQNDVNKNILVHSNSIFPGNAKSTVILAAHSGTGKNAYFKNLYKLKPGDEIYLYYQNKI